MNLFIILDKQRRPDSREAMKIYYRYLRWQSSSTTTFVVGLDKATTLSYTQEHPDLFYNMENYVAFIDTPKSLEQSIRQYTFLYQGDIWEVHPKAKMRLIYSRSKAVSDAASRAVPETSLAAA